MSFTAVIVVEDPTNNGYILKPLIQRMLAACGKPRARVSVLTSPRTAGYEHAKALLKNELIARYRLAGVLLFLPDADGKDRSGEFADLERRATAHGTKLFCCAARQEVEAWLLAGHVERLGVPWQQVRNDSSVKENVFQSFLENFGDSRRPGFGREDLMRETLNGYEGLKARCPELAELEAKLQTLLNAVSA